PPRSTLFPYTTLFRSAVLFAFRALGFRFRSPAVAFGKTHHATKRLACFALCLSPIALIAWSHGQPWHTGYRYPPERSEIIAALEDRKSTRLNSSHRTI